MAEISNYFADEKQIRFAVGIYEDENGSKRLKDVKSFDKKISSGGFLYIDYPVEITDALENNLSCLQN